MGFGGHFCSALTCKTGQRLQSREHSWAGLTVSSASGSDRALLLSLSLQSLVSRLNY